MQKYIFLLKLYGLRKRKLVHIFVLIDFEEFLWLRLLVLSVSSEGFVGDVFSMMDC